MDSTGFDPQLVEYEDAKPRDRGHGLYILGVGGIHVFQGSTVVAHFGIIRVLY